METLNMWHELRRIDTERATQQNTLTDATRLISMLGIEKTMDLSDNATNIISRLAFHLKIGLLAVVLIAAAFAVMLTRTITKSFAERHRLCDQPCHRTPG